MYIRNEVAMGVVNFAQRGECSNGHQAYGAYPPLCESVDDVETTFSRGLIILAMPLS